MKHNYEAIAFLVILFGCYVVAAVYMYRTRLKNPDEEYPPIDTEKNTDL